VRELDDAEEVRTVYSLPALDEYAGGVVSPPDIVTREFGCIG
jgi:hypothetical protein